MGGCPERLRAELGTVVGGDAFARPASSFEVGGSALQECTREARIRVVGRLVECGPGVGACHVDGRVLPGPPLRAAQPSDGEAIQLDDVPGFRRLDVALLLGVQDVQERPGWPCRR